MKDAIANEVYTHLGNGDGTFQSPIAIPVGNAPQAMVAGDFHNDGKLDLAVANSGGNTVTLLLGNGDGTFLRRPARPTRQENGLNAIVAEDFNGRRKLDLNVMNRAARTVSILLQQ